MTEAETIDGEAVEEVDEHEPRALVRRSQAVAVVEPELSVDELVARTDKVKDAMTRAMQKDHHYGVIPGTGTKPSLLKPGAEKLCLLFRLAPSYEVERDYDGDHLTATAKCVLVHGPTGMLVAEGIGLCTTKEKKYAVRRGGRVCPDCGAEAIIKGKAEYGGGWLCFGRKGGCGHKWPDDSEQGREFEETEVGDVPNEDLPDVWNTVVKMAEKRALVAAVLNGTAASDVFTQDVEDAATEERTTGQTEIRRVDPEPPKPPRNWPQVEERFAKEMHNGDPEQDKREAEEWMRQIGVALYGPEGVGGLKPGAERDAARQKYAAIVLSMEEKLPGPGEFPPPSRRDKQLAIAAVLDGAKIEGPPWQISRGEDELPTYADYVAGG